MADVDERQGERKREGDLLVISALKEWSCSLCERDGRSLLIMEDSGPVCLACADLHHLVFLPSGTQH